jgi:predicted DNA-binding transcriptional regulator YafY
MLAALPPDLRARASRIRERFHLDAPGWLREADEVPFLAEIADSVWNERMVEIRYRRWKTPREVTRRLAPLGVVLKAGTWYLVALAGDDIRTFRVSNVLAVQPLDERFDRPADFDLAGYWQEWADQFEIRMRGLRARVRLSPDGVRMLPYFIGRQVAELVAPTLSDPDSDGWVEAVVPVETIRHAHGEFLRFGAEVEVLEPTELREMVTASIAKLAGIYDTRRDGST